MIIEQATIADIEQLCEMRVAYLTDDFGELGEGADVSIVEELKPYLNFHLGRDMKVFVARDDDLIASCAWLLLVDKPPSPRFPRGKTGILFNVYTRRSHRRQGLARRVMEVLIDAGRDQGLDVIELNATDDGYPLYLQLGFADDTMTHKPMRLML
jgi:GNAT superfamily N-acetyltransferase